MKDFRQHFLSESVEKLQNLIADLKNKQSLSDSDKSAVFRTLHTLKGTSQTFGFKTSSRIAHELENLLSAKIQENSHQILIEGVRILKNSVEQKDFEFPEKFIEKLRKVAPSDSKTSNFDQILSKIPSDFFSLLSSQEKFALDEELEKGKNLFCLEIGFGISSFSAGLKNIREVLNSCSEIIATFPSVKFTRKGQIGFQILFASFEKVKQIQEITKDFAAEIIFDSSPENFKYDLQGILAQTISHGKTIAKNLGKSVEFEVSAEKLAISEKKLKLIFEVLLHLIRNAIDHAFETSGKLKIVLESKKNVLFLTVSDNGRGIDLEIIRSKAIEKNLMQKENLSDEATLELIFQPEFSTAKKATEISGRGVGLNAVKNAVEESGGKITVKSKLNKGTSFEIFLPE